MASKFFTEHCQPSRYVASHILWLMRDADPTPMHLIKLTYISHGWMMGLYDEVLIDESVEAWTYGPVVPSVYRRYKFFGGNPVTAVPKDNSDKFTEAQLALMKDVSEAYSEYTALELSNITHMLGTPWDQVTRESGIGAIIPNELIRDWYRKQAQA